MVELYKGILDKRGRPISLVEIVSLYSLGKKFGKASCERVAAQLTAMGYHSKYGGPVNRHQIFRAMMRLPAGPNLLKATRERMGK